MMAQWFAWSVVIAIFFKTSACWVVGNGMVENCQEWHAPNIHDESKWAHVAAVMLTACVCTTN